MPKKLNSIPEAVVRQRYLSKFNTCFDQKLYTAPLAVGTVRTDPLLLKGFRLL